MTKDREYLVSRWGEDDMTDNGKLADVIHKPGTSARTTANTTPLSQRHDNGMALRGSNIRIE